MHYPTRESGRRHRCLIVPSQLSANCAGPPTVSCYAFGGTRVGLRRAKCWSSDISLLSARSRVSSVQGLTILKTTFRRETFGDFFPQSTNASHHGPCPLMLEQRSTAQSGTTKTKRMGLFTALS